MSGKKRYPVEISKVLAIARKRGYTRQLIAHLAPPSNLRRELEKENHSDSVLVNEEELNFLCRVLTDGPRVITPEDIRSEQTVTV